MDEIEIPKDVLPILPEDARETILGDKRGAKKQYRYGNLHIREYDNVYRVHVDRVDPRRDPIGHLIYDAPEVLVGLMAAIGVGYKIYSASRKSPRNVIYSLVSSLLSGYISYRFARYAKERE